MSKNPFGKDQQFAEWLKDAGWFLWGFCSIYHFKMLHTAPSKEKSALLGFSYCDRQHQSVILGAVHESLCDECNFPGVSSFPLPALSTSASDKLVFGNFLESADFCQKF